MTNEFASKTIPAINFPDEPALSHGERLSLFGVHKFINRLGERIWVFGAANLNSCGDAYAHIAFPDTQKLYNITSRGMVDTSDNTIKQIPESILEVMRKHFEWHIRSPPPPSESQGLEIATAAVKTIFRDKTMPDYLNDIKFGDTLTAFLESYKKSSTMKTLANNDDFIANTNKLITNMNDFIEITTKPKPYATAIKTANRERKPYGDVEILNDLTIETPLFKIKTKHAFILKSEPKRIDIELHILQIMLNNINYITWNITFDGKIFSINGPFKLQEDWDGTINWLLSVVATMDEKLSIKEFETRFEKN